MAISPQFREYILEQLGDLPDVRIKSMFGGAGIYSGDNFFGILDDDTLYFRVTDTNRADYETAGMTPFKPFADKPMVMSYYQVPLDVMEDREAICDWARKAIATHVGKTNRK